LNQLLQNASLFPERFIRDGANQIVSIDRTFVNAGGRRTQGIEVAARGGYEFSGGDRILAGIDGTYMLKRKERLTELAPYGESLIGVFSLTGDLSLRWKHNAFLSYQNNDLTVTLTQLYRDSYRNFGLPNLLNNRSATRPDYNERVDPYVVYNFSVSWTGLGPNYRFTAGVRNLFDTDPPFAITYDSNTGAGSSWEPRVADPRGRSFTFAAEVKF
jgi:iron complex outermembrane receptor protein